MTRLLPAILAALTFGPGLRAAEPILLANNPALSPDGKSLAFDWNGDVWTVPTAGGQAKLVTGHPKRDTQPAFSPDGKLLAFVSAREGSNQIYTVPVEGGAPKQVTNHTAGFSDPAWISAGQLLASAARDLDWYAKHTPRFYAIDSREPKAEKLLFDDYGRDGKLSPDGKKLLFTREGVEWWRKGYVGSEASQIWLYDLDSKKFELILADPHGAMSPLWRPDGKGFYFVAAPSGTMNLCEFTFATKQARQITKYDDDSVVFPAISADGSKIVYRHLFDLYSLMPGVDETPRKIEIGRDLDRPVPETERKVVTTAKEYAITGNGLELALVIGNDLYVMDTELREPKRITRDAGEERNPTFSADGQSLYFIADKGA